MSPAVGDFDFAAIGVGPSNLSLAALAAPVTDVRGIFLEARPAFRWHPGMMLPQAQLQVSFLKDLVTLVDPTSPFSFLNFLAGRGLLYRWLAAKEMGCSRQQFERYYQWVAEQIPAIRCGFPVETVELTPDHFTVRSRSGATVNTRTLVVGSGQRFSVPPFVNDLRGPNVLHSGEFLDVRPDVTARRVMVVGGGQSGAEIVNHLLSRDEHLPASLSWVSSRVGFLPMDDSPFTNEWFSPPYVGHFHSLGESRRQTLLQHQRMASDGISESLLVDIYRRLYDLDAADLGRHTTTLLPCHRLVGLAREDAGYTASLHNSDLAQTYDVGVDVVILATGYRSGVPDYLASFGDRLTDAGGQLNVGPDYALEWDGPPGLRIYAQNFAERSHGIADPNLSLSAWRSARILNSMAGREVYRDKQHSSGMHWGIG